MNISYYFEYFKASEVIKAEELKFQNAILKLKQYKDDGDHQTSASIEADANATAVTNISAAAAATASGDAYATAVTNISAAAAATASGDAYATAVTNISAAAATASGDAYAKAVTNISAAAATASGDAYATAVTNISAAAVTGSANNQASYRPAAASSELYANDYDANIYTQLKNIEDEMCGLTSTFSSTSIHEYQKVENNGVEAERLMDIEDFQNDLVRIRKPSPIEKCCILVKNCF